MEMKSSVKAMKIILKKKTEHNIEMKAAKCNGFALHLKSLSIVMQTFGNLNFKVKLVRYLSVLYQSSLNWRQLNKDVKSIVHTT